MQKSDRTELVKISFQKSDKQTNSNVLTVSNQ